MVLLKRLLLVLAVDVAWPAATLPPAASLLRTALPPLLLVLLMLLVFVLVVVVLVLLAMATLGPEAVPLPLPVAPPRPLPVTLTVAVWADPGAIATSRSLPSLSTFRIA